MMKGSRRKLPKNDGEEREGEAEEEGEMGTERMGSKGREGVAASYRLTLCLK